MLTAKIDPNVISYSATISGLPFFFSPFFFEISLQRDAATVLFGNVAPTQSVDTWKKQGLPTRPKLPQNFGIISFCLILASAMPPNEIVFCEICLRKPMRSSNDHSTSQILASPRNPPKKLKNNELLKG